MPPPEDPEGLITQRDLVVRRLRALNPLVGEHLPGDVELRGILGRTRDLLEGQAPSIDALVELDLSRPAAGRAEQVHVIEVLNRALHLPRMVLALGRVVEQETKQKTLEPALAEARRAAAALHDLAQRWLVRQAGSEEGLDGGDDEEEDPTL